MSWVLYIIGCVGFILAALGGIGLVGNFLSDFELRGIGLARRAHGMPLDLEEYFGCVFMLCIGIVFFIAGAPS